MYPCASTTAGKSPLPFGTLSTPEIVYASGPAGVLERLRKVTSYDVKAALRSRTAPRRSRSPRRRCSARPSTDTGRAAGCGSACSASSVGVAVGDSDGGVDDGGADVGDDEREAASPDRDSGSSALQPPTSTAPSVSAVRIPTPARIRCLLSCRRGPPPCPTACTACRAEAFTPLSASGQPRRPA